MALGVVRRTLLPRSHGGTCFALSRHILGNAPLEAVERPRPRGIVSELSRTYHQTGSKSLVQRFSRQHQISIPRPTACHSKCDSPIAALRQFYTSKPVQQDGARPSTNKHDVAAVKKSEVVQETVPPVEPQDKSLLSTDFSQSEKAKQAAQVNYAARLSKEKDAKKRNFWQSSGEIMRLLKLARPELKYLGLAVALLLVSSTVTMSIPYIVGKVMDAATSKSEEEARVFGLTLFQFFGTFAVLLSMGAAANFGRIIVLRIIGERVVARLRASLYKRTFLQDAEFFDANRTGDLISRLSADSIIVGKSITQNVSDGLRSFISGCVGLTAMAWLSPGLSSIILFAAPLLGVITFAYARVIRKLSRDIQKNVGTLTKIAEERLGSVKTSQAFNGERQELNRYSKQIRRIYNLGLKESSYTAMYFGSTGWMGNMTILAMLWFGGSYVREGLLSLGDLTSFMMYAAFAGGSMSGLSGFFTELMKGVGAASRLFELEDRQSSISPTKGVPVKSARGPVIFDKVTFAYPTRPAVRIFNELDFTIPSGSNVCIVGPSGGGKSTVTSLILRFYNPTSGTISINGTDITKMNAKSLRRRIGVVSQEPVLFSGTIKENIAYGRPEASDAEVFLAAQEANCQFIKDFPEGMSTQVGPRGAQLSGGQKQRIAIARALLKNPDILILDEATSALDAESETLVNSALTKLLSGNSTTISIAHRLSTIKRSDQIIVLSNEGTVAEMGPYSKLSTDPASAFSKLMEWQMSGGEATPTQPRHVPAHDTEVIEEGLEEDIEDDLDEDLDDERTRKALDEVSGDEKPRN